MLPFLWWVVTALWVFGSALFVYWLLDKPARRRYFWAAYAAFGVAMGLQALAYYLAHSPSWTVGFGCGGRGADRLRDLGCTAQKEIVIRRRQIGGWSPFRITQAGLDARGQPWQPVKAITDHWKDGI